MTQNRRIDADLRLAQRRVQVGAEVMIKTPAQDLLAYCGDFRIEVRVNNLRQDGLVLRNLEGIGDHCAFGIAQPRGRFVAFQHGDAAFRVIRFIRLIRFGHRNVPDVFFLDARVELELGFQRLLVSGGKPDLQLVAELLRFKAKHDALGRFLVLIADALASSPEDAGRAALFGDRSRQLPLRRARHQDQRVVQIGLPTTVRAGEDVDGLQFEVKFANRTIAGYMDLLDHGWKQYQTETDLGSFPFTPRTYVSIRRGQNGTISSGAKAQFCWFLMSELRLRPLNPARNSFYFPCTRPETPSGRAGHPRCFKLFSYTMSYELSTSAGNWPSRTPLRD